MDFNKLTRDFLAGAWKNDKFLSEGVSPLSRFRAIKEAIQTLKPRTIKERQRVELALDNLNHVRRSHRQLEEKFNILMEENTKLNEKIKLIEENIGDD